MCLFGDPVQCTPVTTLASFARNLGQFHLAVPMQGMQLQHQLLSKEAEVSAAEGPNPLENLRGPSERFLRRF